MTAPGLPEGFALLDAGFGADERARIARELLLETPWEAHVFRIFGRSVPMPRLIAWYGEQNYTYSGVFHPARPLTPLLSRLLERVQDRTSARFNTVLLNLYRDGDDAMGWHSDDDYTPGVTSSIASLSLGAARRFQLRRDGGDRRTLTLPDGSILLMGEGVQARWAHALPRDPEVHSFRVNLTFRSMRVEGVREQRRP